MKEQPKLLPCITIILLIIVLGGCAARVMMIPPPAQPPVLKYVMPEGKVFNYKMSTGFLQTMSVKGIPIKTTVLNDFQLSMTQLAYAEKAYQLQVRINDVSMKITAPGTNLSPNLNNLVGKSFEMTITEQGEEIGIMGADDLTYSFGDSEKRSLANEFKNFFPNLPDYPLDVGTEWTDVDTIDISEGGTSTFLIISSANTLTGYELVNNHECAKIEVDYASSITSSGVQQGAAFDTAIQMTGKETMYFDYKQGVLVKMVSSGSGDGVANVKGEKAMSLPMSQTVTIDVELME